MRVLCVGVGVRASMSPPPSTLDLPPNPQQQHKPLKHNHQTTNQTKPNQNRKPMEVHLSWGDETEKANSRLKVRPSTPSFSSHTHSFFVFFFN